MRIKIIDLGIHDNFYRHRDNFIGQYGELSNSIGFDKEWKTGTVKFDSPVEFGYRKTKSKEKVGPINQAYFHQFKYEKV
jgi:hypothetical protein